MEILKTIPINLDLKRVTAQASTIPPLVVGDNGNVFEITLTDGGLPVDLSDCRVLAVFSTPDGVTVEQDTDGNGVTIGGDAHNVVTIDIRTGSFSDGKNNCELQLYSGPEYGTLVTTAQFNFDGRRGIMNDETIISTNEYPVLVGLIKSTEVASAKSAEAVAAAEDAVKRADEAVEKAEGVVEALGDMTQAVYDTNHNGIVDDAEKLGGQPPSFYASAASVSEELAAITLASLGGEPKRLQFENTTVVAGAFVADSTMAEYGYRATVALSGVTAGMVPDVIFSQASVSLGIFSCNAVSFNGGIYIYASEIPEEAVVIPTIIVWK